MTKVDKILKRPYTWIFVSNEKGGFCAKILEFDGCWTEDETLVKTANRMKTVARAWVEGTIEDGMSIPEPRGEQEFLRKPNSIFSNPVIENMKNITSLTARISRLEGLVEQLLHNLGYRGVKKE